LAQLCWASLASGEKIVAFSINSFGQFVVGGQLVELAQTFLSLRHTAIVRDGKITDVAFEDER